jgi:hypothetical protein
MSGNYGETASLAVASGDHERFPVLRHVEFLSVQKLQRGILPPRGNERSDQS